MGKYMLLEKHKDKDQYLISIFRHPPVPLHDRCISIGLYGKVDNVVVMLKQYLAPMKGSE